MQYVSLIFVGWILLLGMTGTSRKMKISAEVGERFPILSEGNDSGTEEKRGEKMRCSFNVQNVSRFDDEAPSSPDGTSGC